MLLILNNLLFFSVALKIAIQRYPYFSRIFLIFGLKRTHPISNFRRWSQLEMFFFINKSPKIYENHCQTLNKVEHFM